MRKIYINSKEVELVSVEGEVNEYAEAIEAVYVEDGKELDDNELAQLNARYPEEIYYEYYQSVVGAAEARQDAFEDR